MNSEWFMFETHVCKIPCIIVVSYPDYDGWDFEIRDRHGRKADWLRRKVEADEDKFAALIEKIRWEVDWHDQP